MLEECSIDQLVLLRISFSSNSLFKRQSVNTNLPTLQIFTYKATIQTASHNITTNSILH